MHQGEPTGSNRRRFRVPPGWRSSVAVLLALFSLCSLPLAQDASPDLEHQVKAAFLYNFARFVEWPPDTPSGDASFTIGVLGTDPTSLALEETVQGKSVGGRTIQVRAVKSHEEAAQCHMLFVGSETPERLARLLKALRGTAVLTVGDSDTFAREGGIVNFVMQDHHVRFAVNTDAAERAGLKISSKLLQLAIIVHDEHGREETK
jgi:hypothetical protein